MRLTNGDRVRPAFSRQAMAGRQSFESSVDRRLPDGMTPAEFDRLRRLPPRDLTPEQVARLRAVRDSVETPRNLPVQRALPPETLRSYLSNNPIPGIFDPSRARGFTSRYADTQMLTTPGGVYEGLRLDYHDPGYVGRNGRPPYLAGDLGVAVMRYSLARPGRLSTPYGGPTPEDRAAMGGGVSQSAPFTGNGFTASEHHAVPEFEMAENTVPNRAEIYLLDRDGNETLLARYRVPDRQWVVTEEGQAILDDAGWPQTTATATDPATTPTATSDPAATDPAAAPDPTAMPDPAATPDPGTTDPGPDPAPAAGPARTDFTAATDAEALAAMTAAMSVTANGVLAFHAGPSMPLHPDRLRGVPGHVTIAAHTGRDGSVLVGGHQLTAEQFANALNTLYAQGLIDLGPPGTPLRLVMCRLAGGPGAATVAAVTGRQVRAATDLVWAWRDGSEMVAPADPARGGLPSRTERGEWRTIDPDGTVVSSEPGDRVIPPDDDVVNFGAGRGPPGQNQQHVNAGLGRAVAAFRSLDPDGRIAVIGDPSRDAIRVRTPGGPERTIRVATAELGAGDIRVGRSRRDVLVLVPDGQIGTAVREGDDAAIDRLLTDALSRGIGEVGAGRGGRTPSPVTDRRRATVPAAAGRLRVLEAQLRAAQQTTLPDAARVAEVEAELQRFVEEQGLRDGRPGSEARREALDRHLPRSARALLDARRGVDQAANPAAAMVRGLFTDGFRFPGVRVMPSPQGDHDVFRITPRGWFGPGLASFTVRVLPGTTADGVLIRDVVDGRHFDLVVDPDLLAASPGTPAAWAREDAISRVAEAVQAMVDRQAQRPAEMVAGLRNRMAEYLGPIAGGLMSAGVAAVWSQVSRASRTLSSGAYDAAANPLMSRRTALHRLDRSHDRALGSALNQPEVDRGALQSRIAADRERITELAGDRVALDWATPETPSASATDARANRRERQIRQSVHALMGQLDLGTGVPVEGLAGVGIDPDAQPTGSARYRLRIRGGVDVTVSVRVVTGAANRTGVGQTAQTYGLSLDVPVQLATNPQALERAVRDRLATIAAGRQRHRRSLATIAANIRRQLAPETLQHLLGRPHGNQIRNERDQPAPAPHTPQPGPTYAADVNAANSLTRSLIDAIASRARLRTERELKELRKAFDSTPPAITARSGRFGYEQAMPMRGSQRRALAESLADVFRNGERLADALRTRFAPASTRQPRRMPTPAVDPSVTETLAAARQAVRLALAGGPRRARIPYRISLGNSTVTGDRVELRLTNRPHRQSRVDITIPPGMDRAEVVRQVTEIATALRDRQLFGVRPLGAYLLTRVPTAVATALGGAASAAVLSNLSALLAGGVAAVGTVAGGWAGYRSDRRAALAEVTETIGDDPSTMPPRELRAVARQHREAVEALEAAFAERERRILADHPGAADRIAALGDQPRPLAEIVTGIRDAITAVRDQLPVRLALAPVDDNDPHVVRLDFSGSGSTVLNHTFTFDIAAGQTQQIVNGTIVRSDVHASIIVDPSASQEAINRQLLEWLHRQINETVELSPGLIAARRRAEGAGVAGLGAGMAAGVALVATGGTASALPAVGVGLTQALASVGTSAVSDARHDHAQRNVAEEGDRRLRATHTDPTDGQLEVAQRHLASLVERTDRAVRRAAELDRIEADLAGPDPSGARGGRGTDPVTAVGVDGTRLRGRFGPRPEPAAVVDTARRALPEMVARVLGDRVTGIEDLGDGRYRIHPADGRAFEITLDAGDLSGVSTARGRDVVAHTVRSGRSGYRVRLSDRLETHAVPEALIHELREVLALRSGSLRQRLTTRFRRDTLTRGTELPAGGPLSGHDHGGLGQLDLHGDDAQALRGTGWPWVRTVFESAALTRHLGLDPGNPAAPARLDRLRAESAINPATRNLLDLLSGQPSLTPAEQLVVRMAHSLAATPPRTGEPADLYAGWARAVADLAHRLNHPQAAGELVAGFLGDLDPVHLSQLANRDPATYRRLLDALPPGSRPTGRIPAAELRHMAAAYPTADDAARLAIRGQVAATVDRYRSQRDHAAADRLLLDLPPDVRFFLDRLALSTLDPATIHQVAASHLPGAPPTSASLRAADFARNLMDGGQPVHGPALRDALDRLAVEGERAITSLPRMPHLAGQIVRPDPALMNALGAADPALANRVWQAGLYVDLRGVVDLTPYAPQGYNPVTLGPVGAHVDPSNPGGRAAIILDDQRRAEVTYRAAYLMSPQVAHILATHRFHHTGTVRSMLPVPIELADLVAAMNPGQTPVADPAAGLHTQPGGNDLRLVGHRPELVPNARQSITYGTPLDAATGRMPLWQGAPSREQFGQGVLGNCGTIATIRSVAARLPHALGQAVRANEDGTYTVRLAQAAVNGNAVTPTGSFIDVVVDGSLPVLGGAAGSFAYGRPVGAAWGAIIESAFASLDQSWDMQRLADQHNAWYWSEVAESQQNNNPAPDRFQAAPTGYQTVVGAPLNQLAEMMTQLTGHPARASAMDTSPSREAVMRQRLEHLIAVGSPVIVCTQDKNHFGAQTLPHNLVRNHAYEVVSVNPDGTVTLSNPWNRPNDDPATMPLADFLDLMADQMVHLEVAQPAVPPAPAPGPAPGPFTTGQERAMPEQETEPETVRPEVSDVTSGSPRERGTPPRRYTPQIITVDYYILRMPDNSEAGVMVLVSRDGEMTSVWQVAGGFSWQHATGAVLPPEAPGARPDPVDRAGAEATSWRVLRQALPPEAWLKSLAGY